MRDKPAPGGAVYGREGMQLAVRRAGAAALGAGCGVALSHCLKRCDAPCETYGTWLGPLSASCELSACDGDSEAGADQ